MFQFMLVVRKGDPAVCLHPGVDVLHQENKWHPSCAGASHKCIATRVCKVNSSGLWTLTKGTVPPFHQVACVWYTLSRGPGRLLQSPLSLKYFFTTQFAKSVEQSSGSRNSLIYMIMQMSNFSALHLMGGNYRKWESPREKKICRSQILLEERSRLQRLKENLFAPLQGTIGAARHLH